MTTPKKSVNRQGYKVGESVVYPAHGVGRITAIEEQEIAGFKLELFVVSFDKDKMVLRVPTAKAGSVGMRKLAEPDGMQKALDVLTGRARIKRTMWSRRAQEYEAKINSGDLIAVAEVVRDLHRAESQPEQSYSERQLYEAALDRVVRELAHVNRITDTEATKLIEANLAKSPKRAKTGEGEADADLQDEAA
ncbi:CarD family transcriptional regulator [uncultured Enterovirga sp.]|uniref:CarD family transcriptional regulator n=1 Tax=uncultured Enterovirga sp. TaxID=2026352 RepID=UPI0035CBFDA7